MSALTTVPEPLVCHDLVGRQLLQKHCLFYPPDVTPSDVLEVDFNVHTIGPDGLYLIEYPPTGDGQNSFNCAWHGVRKFQDVPLKGLRIFESDEWRPLNAAHRAMRVLGRVTRVYREV